MNSEFTKNIQLMLKNRKFLLLVYTVGFLLVSLVVIDLSFELNTRFDIFHFFAMLLLSAFGYFLASKISIYIDPN